jgi:methylase of polypeptide subunit release factors
MFRKYDQFSVIDILVAAVGAIILSIANHLRHTDFFPLITWFASDISLDALSVASKYARTFRLRSCD